ncbi:MAG: maleylacetate reductase [Pseudomonadota bacterium]
MDSFVYTGLPSRVVFGAGKIGQLMDEVGALSIERALVLTTLAQRDLGERVQTVLGKRAVGLFSEAAMHTPVNVTDKAMAAYAEARADGVIAVGGGSTIGLGKAIALRNDAPQLVLPTTYAGSEMTTIIGQTEGGKKTTQRTLSVLPETVLYDVDLTLGLPVKMSVTSGVNAIAHAVEAMYAQNANPVLSLMAEEGIAALMRALPTILKSPNDRGARHDALYGAWLCAICLGSGGVALHHKLCHVLGGSFDLPHAETHAVILPQALAYNAPAVEPTMKRLRRAVGDERPGAVIYDLVASSGAPVSLRELGMPEDGIDRAVEITFENPYWNPRPLERAGVRDVIQAAWEGRYPTC